MSAHDTQGTIVSAEALSPVELGDTRKRYRRSGVQRPIGTTFRIAVLRTLLEWALPNILNVNMDSVTARGESNQLSASRPLG